MKLHEFQSKQVLSRYGLATPNGGVAITAEEARQIASALVGPKLVVKVQMPTADYDKASGTRFVSSPAEVEKAARELIGKKLITEKSGPAGITVKRVLVEVAVNATRGVHLSMQVDPSAGGIVLIAKSTGADLRPDASSIEQVFLGPGDSYPRDDVLQLAARLGLPAEVRPAFSSMIEGLLRAFVELDALRIEVDPLVIQPDGSLLALDARLSVDDNALFRQPALVALREEDEIEVNAQRRQLNYVRLDGNIGLAANGAGLGLATLDMVRAANGRPANFMDIRTTATSLDVAHGFSLILDSPKVRALLVNVHGGGMQPCDTIAEGLGIAMRRTGRSLPTVVRLAGNNAAFARSRFVNFGCRIIDCPDMWTAAKEAVAAAR